MEKDKSVMKQRIEQLEKENKQLKKSLFEYSLRLNTTSQPPFRPSLMDHVESSTNLLYNQPNHSYDSSTNPTNPFITKSILQGHTGAVYSVSYSKNGRILASGSFDRTIRLWDVDNAKCTFILQGHGLNVSCVCWTDEDEVVSGAYDQTIRMWDVNTGKGVMTTEVEGFVQCVEEKAGLVYCGTSRKKIVVVDRRIGVTLEMINEFMVNALVVTSPNLNNNNNDDVEIVTGDAGGYIKTWDTRMGKCCHSVKNEAEGRPISHIAICPSPLGSSLLAVNSYDNIIRVYEREKNNLTLLQALKGLKNKNWPIRSSFYSFPTPANSDKQIEVFLATGSAEEVGYVYNLEGKLIQRLEGHADRVYDCKFSPTEPLLATASADFSVRLWALK